MATVYVTGHRNPDTDSIAAAIGYAELKGRLDPDNTYLPVRLGDVNAQTRWVLQLANYRHVAGAACYIAAAMGHIYIGTIGMEGAFEAMGSGEVDYNWARQHHSLWLDAEMARTGPNESQRQPLATPAE